MLNYIWLALLGLAVLIGGLRGNMDVVGAAVIASTELAIKLAATLLGLMTLWLGLIRLAEKAGLINRLGLALRPIMTWLFPEVPPDHPAMGSIVLNVAANILGLNNAATPLGLRAINELNQLNQRPGVATNAMCMLMAINTSSITLIPVTVITIMTAAHGRNPTQVIGPALIASLVAHIAAITTCKLLENSRFFRLTPLPAGEISPSPALKTTVVESGPNSGKAIADRARAEDALLPWVPGAGYILAVVGGLFLALFVVTAFPQLRGPETGLDAFAAAAAKVQSAGPFFMQAPGAAIWFFLHRLIDALSILAMPTLILFFPLYAALRKIPVYEEFVEGAKESIAVILRILPYIVGMLVATGMFSASGGMALISYIFSPLTNLIGFPAALLPLAVIRPFSAAASLPLLQNVVGQYGPDSVLAMTAGAMYGCSETTFYVLALYFGSVGIRKTRHAIPAGIIADIVGPLASVAICRAMFS